MNHDVALADPIAGLHSGASDAHSAAGPVTRLAQAVTPDLRRDARVALRDMRVKDTLREVLQDRIRNSDLALSDATAADPFADSSGRMLERLYSVLETADDKVALLQIPEWLATDGAEVGALNEIRDAFMNAKVRIVAPGVETPDLSLEETLPRIWRRLGNIDVKFVSWRRVTELKEGKHSPGVIFGIEAAGGAAKAAMPPRPKRQTKRVFLSSTGKDLQPYRKVAGEACLAMGFMPIMMEHFEAMGLGATAGSLKKLDQADIYVGIFAHRYGYIEPGYPVSVTEMEFDHAASRQIPQLCFVVDPAHPWSPDAWDPEHHEEMAKFKKRVDRLIRGQFTTPDSLKALLVQALAHHQ